jgi:N-acetylglucosaminyldiphosphoundecaprenol N-acetyl-beta-D-mannosaminyltransferase
MKLSQIDFYHGVSTGFWEEYLQKPVFILPMHAEKWHLIEKKSGWDEILKGVDLFVADGVGLVWGYRFLTGKRVQKISGIDLINRLIEELPETPTYIWGTKPEIIANAVKSYKEKGLNVVGYHDGFSGKDEEIIAEIKKSGAKVCFVGMGARRAAEIALRIHRELGITTMTAGGSFDVASGEFKRAPLMFQKVGLEWLWRMFADPKRFKRLPALMGFVWDIMREKMDKEVRSKK